MTLAYRGVDQIAESRFTAIRETLAAELDGLAPLVRVCARRRARIVGGGVAIAMGVLGFLAAFLPVAEHSGWLDRSGSGAGTFLFLAAWPTAAITTSIARLVSRRTLALRVAAPLERTGDALGDLARLERLDPVRAYVRTAKERERLSVALPLAGIALLAPLTLHFLVSLVIAGSNHGETAADFDVWIRWSALLVGHAHVVLAICGYRFARRLASRETATIALGTSRDGFAAVGWTTLASLVPGAILFLVPPALVLFTGAAFAPLAYASLGRSVCAERRVIEAAEKA
jgi:hypothetical protein